MEAKLSGAKGYEFEEALKNYFLRANYYVLRSLPLRLEGDDITDVDIWLYERPSGFSRRRIIVDAKFKTKPKAAERLFWTKGARDFLQVDEAYVATTDSRDSVREMGGRIGIAVIDGTDLGRIASSEKIETPERLSGEEMATELRSIDRARMDREWSEHLEDAKSSLLEDFGVASGNRCLGAFSYFAAQAAVSHPSSDSAIVAVRHALLIGSMAAVSLDYVASSAAFRTSEERRRMLANAIRFGNVNQRAGLEKVRISTALIEQFLENGAAFSRQILNKYSDEVSKIPAEIVADHVARISSKDTLFAAARELEAAAHARTLRGFDSLTADTKSLIASFLDFCGIAREKFAKAVMAPAKVEAEAPSVNTPSDSSRKTSRADGPLFGAPSEESTKGRDTREPKKPRRAAKKK